MTAPRMVWKRGTVLQLPPGELLCLLSGDVPLTTDGRPRVDWFKLGIEDGQERWVEPGFCDPAVGGRQPCAPPGLSNVRVLVRLGDVNWPLPFPVQRPGWAAIPSGPSSVKDWPIACPRCGRAESAVMLFNSVDCRWGCYGGSR